jgi:hypothetical protein
VTSVALPIPDGPGLGTEVDVAALGSAVLDVAS